MTAVTYTAGTHNARISPRSHKRHQRYARAARHPRSMQLNEFLRVEAARLSSSAATLFGKLNKYSADQVVAAASMSNLA